LRVAGVIANCVGSENHAEILRESLAAAGLPPLLGAIPRNDKWAMAERHLGLVTAAEGGCGEQWFADLAEGIEAHVDLDRVLLLTESATAPSVTGIPACPAFLAEATARKRDKQQSSTCFAVCDENVLQPTELQRPVTRLGIAVDEAFQFYYEDNLDLLRESGVELVSFSPLHDAELPRDVNGLYFGGGYPELYAERLSLNCKMRELIRTFADTGKPVYGECGGFMYICESLRDGEGREWPMCGLLPVSTKMGPRLRRLGYVEAQLIRDGIFGGGGTRIRGHEYHWSDIESDVSGVEPLFTARHVRDGAENPTGLRRGDVCASYLHLHFASNPAAVKAWVGRLSVDR